VYVCAYLIVGSGVGEVVGPFVTSLGIGVGIGVIFLGVGSIVVGTLVGSRVGCFVALAFEVKTGCSVGLLVG
jgi:hypothetical protein